MPPIRDKTVHFPGGFLVVPPCRFPVAPLSVSIIGENAGNLLKFGSLSPEGRTRNAGRMAVEAIVLFRPGESATDSWKFGSLSRRLAQIKLIFSSDKDGKAAHTATRTAE